MSVSRDQDSFLVPSMPEAYTAPQELLNLLVPVSLAVQDSSLALVSKGSMLTSHAPALMHCMVPLDLTVNELLRLVPNRGKPGMISPLPPSPDSEPISLLPIGSAPPWSEEADSSCSEVNSYV